MPAKPARRATAPLLLFILTTALLAFAASARAEAKPAWRSTFELDPGQHMSLALARADVTLRASTDRRVTIRIEARGAARDLELARVVSTVVAGTVRIEDRYPPILEPPRECLPDLAERGDVWTSNVRFVVTISAPADAPIALEVMDGVVVDRRREITPSDHEADPRESARLRRALALP